MIYFITWRESSRAGFEAISKRRFGSCPSHRTSILNTEEVLRILGGVQQEGKVRFLGASGSVCEETSIEALKTGVFQALQHQSTRSPDSISCLQPAAVQWIPAPRVA